MVLLRYLWAAGIIIPKKAKKAATFRFFFQQEQLLPIRTEGKFIFVIAQKRC
jgi:hypothetical protein